MYSNVCYPVHHNLLSTILTRSMHRWDNIQHNERKNKFRQGIPPLHVSNASDTHAHILRPEQLDSTSLVIWLEVCVCAI